MLFHGCQSTIGNIKDTDDPGIIVDLSLHCSLFYAQRRIYEFYALGAFVGFIMGGVQSLSRSTYSKLMPETKDTASFFSFYDVTEKIAAVVGIINFWIYH